MSKVKWSKDTVSSWATCSMLLRALLPILAQDASHWVHSMIILIEHIARDLSQYPQKFGYEYGWIVLIEWPEWKTASAPQPLARGEHMVGVEITPLHILTGHRGHSDDVVFSPDGTCIASCGEDMTVRVWSTDSGEMLRTIVGHEGL